MSPARLIFLLSWAFTACHSTAPAPMVIHLQPYSDMDSNKTVFVYREFCKIYPRVVLNKPIPLPASAYNSTRKRYRADSLIAQLQRKTPDGHFTVALTEQDISTTKNGIADWGVMGLGFCPGKSCVSSTFRLAAHQKKQQLLKVALHELGHTQGLPHCGVKYCYMRDAEGKNHTEEETGFCPDCRAILTQKGLAFPAAQR